MSEISGFSGGLPRASRRTRLVKIKEASIELDMDAGVLRRWCKLGRVRSEQPGGVKGDYWVYLTDGKLVFTSKQG